MQDCPTSAISFSNVNDRESDVYKIRYVEQTNRAFYVLDQLHTLSNINYLAKIKNTDREVSNEKGGDHDAPRDEAKKDEKEPHA